MNEITEDAALVADAMIIVRARFVEACHTLAHVDMSNLNPAKIRSFWPAIPTQVDQDYRTPYRPSAAAISRAEETLQRWLLDYVPDEEHRTLIVRWAGGLATPKLTGSFRAFCKETHRSRTTAERRLYVAFQSIASGLLKNAKSLHEPDWARVVPLLPKSDTDFDMVAERVAERQAHWRADDARPSDQPELRDTSWAEDQNRRRRARAERAAAEAEKDRAA